MPSRSSVDRQALVTQQAELGPRERAGGGEPHLRAGADGVSRHALDDAHDHAQRGPDDIDVHLDDRGRPGGASTSPSTPSPIQASALMAASGYTRAGTGTWHNDFAVPLTLELAVDESDPWAASAAPQLQSQLESAGFTVSLIPARSAAAAGELLATGRPIWPSPPHLTPFLSETVAWYSDLLGPPGQDGSQNWTNYDNGTFDSLVTQASQQLNRTTGDDGLQDGRPPAVGRHRGSPAVHRADCAGVEPQGGGVTPTPTSNSLLWYAQYWAVRVPEATNNTTPSSPCPGAPEPQWPIDARLRSRGAPRSRKPVGVAE